MARKVACEQCRKNGRRKRTAKPQKNGWKYMRFIDVDNKVYRAWVCPDCQSEWIG